MNDASPSPVKIDLTTFFLSITSAAYMGFDSKNIPLARQNIDLLELMKEKTKGNLSSDESKLIEQLLFELRMKFIDHTKSK